MSEPETRQYRKLCESWPAHGALPPTRHPAASEDLTRQPLGQEGEEDAGWRDTGPAQVRQVKSVSSRWWNRPTNSRNDIWVYLVLTLLTLTPIHVLILCSSNDHNRKRPLIVYDGISSHSGRLKVRKPEGATVSATGIRDRLKPPPAANLLNPIRRLSSSSSSSSSSIHSSTDVANLKRQANSSVSSFSSPTSVMHCLGRDDVIQGKCYYQSTLLGFANSDGVTVVRGQRSCTLFYSKTGRMTKYILYLYITGVWYKLWGTRWKISVSKMLFLLLRRKERINIAMMLATVDNTLF